MTPVPQPDPDWTQLADEAAENANLANAYQWVFQKLNIHLTHWHHCPPLNSRHVTPLAHAVLLNISMTTFL